MIGEMVGRRTVVQMGVRDHANLFKRLEVAIDRGQGQGRTTVPGDRSREPVGCGVAKHTDRVNDPFPLPGQPHAPGPQPLAKVLHMSEPISAFVRLGSTT